MIFVNGDLDLHFQKCFTYYDTGTWALQNVRRARGLLYNFVFARKLIIRAFHSEKGGKRQNIWEKIFLSCFQTPN